MHINRRGLLVGSSGLVPSRHCCGSSGACLSSYRFYTSKTKVRSNDWLNVGGEKVRIAECAQTKGLQQILWTLCQFYRYCVVTFFRVRLSPPKKYPIWCPGQGSHIRGGEN